MIKRNPFSLILLLVAGCIFGVALIEGAAPRMVASAADCQEELEIGSDEVPETELDSAAGGIVIWSGRRDLKCGRRAVEYAVRKDGLIPFMHALGWMLPLRI